MKKIILSIIILVIVPVISFSQVRIELKSGEYLLGVITENSKDTIKIIDENKVNLLIPRSKTIGIEHIGCYIRQNGSDEYYGRFTDYSDKYISMICADGIIRKFDYASSEISFKSRNYSFAGLTLVSPGGVNLNIGSYINDKIGFSLSGGCLPGAILGMQTNVLYNLSRNENVDLNVGLAFGGTSFTHNGDYWIYGGFTCDLNYRGFFIQPCLSFGMGDIVSPQVLFQVGYVYRFND